MSAKAAITVLNGGTQTTVQDAGRPGHRHLGIPRSGAADRLSFAVANHLVGNAWDAPALECALGGLHLRFETEATIAITGAHMGAQVQGMNVERNRAVGVDAGDILTLSYAREGCRAYVAIAGGLAATSFLGSVSTYMPAALGGIEGRALKAGDGLGLAGPAQGPARTLPKGYIPSLSSHAVLRARAGPELDRLSAESRRYLFNTPFIATPATDRMGSRLRGDRIVTDEPLSMTSGPLLPGTLQCPPDGQPILALADGHCTGGYARGLHVIQADQWLLGQIAPGMQISFRRALDGEAPDILQTRNAVWGTLIPGFGF
ncbi:biotin-dependent carboxyltransferase family protein [uncultured Algimonas sp.]|uniref:5-oxoprolinase subunit C family protein n=1 Tax=uncultured Algimonas sp. TaxID=1547920 RepID=UPI002609E844|nr:biotin-dependent carboxyltransferase family protein [uncultured Algimonas sp.]